MCIYIYPSENLRITDFCAYVYQRPTSSHCKSYSINALRLVSRYTLPNSIERKTLYRRSLKMFFYTLLLVILLNQGVFDPMSR